MNINWDNDEYEMAACQQDFNLIGPKDAIFMTHYELANHPQSSITAEQWKRFLMNPRVAEWISIELDLFNQAQLKKIIRTATTNDRSVGTAQMITALNKNITPKENKDGPIFIYTYVPLNDQEMQAPNVRQEQRDIFRWEDGE